MPTQLELTALPGIPLIEQGDDLAALLLDAVTRSGQALEDGDVLVLAQKIVSKAEGRLVRLADVTPSARARELAEQTAKDPRLVELILAESTDIVRLRPGNPGVIVVEHRNGWVHANAGIDQSNVREGDPGEWALLLPADPDRSAADLRAALQQATGRQLGVIINDSFGRAWRVGTCGVALGSAGIHAVQDLRGAPDMFGRRLEVTVIGTADEIAAAASLAMGQGSERTPAVLVRGLDLSDEHGRAADLIRPRNEDLFR